MVPLFFENQLKLINMKAKVVGNLFYIHVLKELLA